MSNDRFKGGSAGHGKNSQKSGSEYDSMNFAEDGRAKVAGIFDLLCTNQHELKEFPDRIPLPMFALDTEHTVITWNRACEQITGTPAKEILGKREAWRAFYSGERPLLADLLVDDATEEDVAEFYGDGYTRSEIFPDIYMAEDFFPDLGKNGLWLFFSASPLRDTDGNIVGAIEILADVTQCKEAERASRESKTRYRQLFEQSSLGILLVDSNYKFLDVNPMALEILGYAKEEMLGMHAEDVIHPEDQRNLPPETNLQRMAAGESLRTERRYRKKNGEYIPVEVSLSYLKDGSSVDHIVMFHDIVQRKQAEEKAHYLAYFDELTGLPNRRLFYDRLKQVMERSGRSVCGGALILVDIDRLKSVNDSLGQQMGDEYIEEIGHRIRNTLRSEGTVARISGGEFMILAEEIDCGASAYKLCRRIMDRSAHPIDLSGNLVYPEVSIGFTLILYQTGGPDTLIKQTNMAMNEASKSAEKIRGFVEQEDWISREFFLEQDLKRALENDEFTVFYQPQIDLGTGHISGVEALIRWNHPEKGMVSPAEFIPVLERTGMIASVDEWVLRRVCEQLRNWQEKGVYIKTSVNISAQELDSDYILQNIRKTLDETRVEGKYLEVELTETEIMKNTPQASKILHSLAEWGIQVALDDFGKGYSSLSHLQKLPIRVIKIDKQFVDGLPDGEEAVTLVQTIIAMAHNLGKKALAEGVESEGQARILRELGCDFAQGYLWSPPLPAEELRLK